MKFRELYERIGKPSVRVIVYNDNDEVLILQRGSTAPWMPNKWNLVGGMTDEGETPIDSAKRETMEEAGLMLDDLQFEGKVIDGVYDIFVFSAYANTDIIKMADNENVRYAWITKGDVYKYEFIPKTMEILDLAFKTYPLDESTQTVYHGTNDNISKFKLDNDKIGWFTDDMGYASTQGDKIYIANLAPKKILDKKSLQKITDEDLIKAFKKMNPNLDKFERPIKYARKDIDKYVKQGGSAKSLFLGLGDVELIKLLGFDMEEIESPYNKGSRFYLVFDDKIIKNFKRSV